MKDWKIDSERFFKINFKNKLTNKIYEIKRNVSWKQWLIR